MSIVTALALTTGATFAFFTDSAQSSNNALTTGTLSVALDQSAGIFQNSTTITNWQPGEQRFVRFDAVNDGSLPVNLRSFATGTWNNGTLDPTKVKVVNVEFWNGSGWQSIMSNPLGITGLVYYSPNGLEASLFELAASSREEFRLTVELDGSAGNTYQNAIFNATVTVHAKQVTPGSTWPTP